MSTQLLFIHAPSDYSKLKNDVQEMILRNPKKYPKYSYNVSQIKLK